MSWWETHLGFAASSCCDSISEDGFTCNLNEMIQPKSSCTLSFTGSNGSPQSSSYIEMYYNNTEGDGYVKFPFGGGISIGVGCGGGTVAVSCSGSVAFPVQRPDNANCAMVTCSSTGPNAGLYACYSGSIAGTASGTGFSGGGSSGGIGQGDPLASTFQVCFSEASPGSYTGNLEIDYSGMEQEYISNSWGSYPYSGTINVTLSGTVATAAVSTTLTSIGDYDALQDDWSSRTADQGSDHKFDFFNTLGRFLDSITPAHAESGNGSCFGANSSHTLQITSTNSGPVYGDQGSGGGYWGKTAASIPIR